MKHLSKFCTLLWVIPFLGKLYLPDVFSFWYIQWTSFALLSVLLPYGFATSLFPKIEHKYALSFLFIFLINMFSTGVGLNLLITANTFLTTQTQLIPENTSLEAINNESSEVRKVIAKVIYTEFGQPIFYKDESNKQILYRPSEDDQKEYESRFSTGAKAKQLIKQTTAQITEIIYLFAFACCSFFVIFFLTYRIEQRKALKKINKDT